MISPVFSERRPGPTASTSPCWGFSLAVSGITRPDAVFSSASLGRTTMRSSRGFSAICGLRWLGCSGVSTRTGRVLTLGRTDPVSKRLDRVLAHGGAVAARLGARRERHLGAVAGGPHGDRAPVGGGPGG